MERVVTINLNGTAYQLDETAYAALRAYLDQAGIRLKINPDRAEILTDLEQAIAEKCSRFLGPHKNVVSAAEIDQVLKEMGPVESPEGDSEATTATAAGAPSPDAKPQADGRPGPKRLYRIRDGAMFMGVCNGIAAYLSIDVTFVRIAFVIGVLVTFGWGWLGYWILGFVIPEARTADEHAAAHGKAPFNAQDVIDDARRAAETFKSQAASTSREFRRQAREQQRQWREQARAWRRASRTASRSATAMWGGPFLPLYGFASFVGFFALVFATISLVGTGTLWGWSLPGHMPVWVGIVVLFAFFHLLTVPLRAAKRAQKHGWNWNYAWLSAWDSLVGMVVFAFAVWMFFRHMPPTDSFREFVQHVPEALSGAAHEIVGWLRSIAHK